MGWVLLGLGRDCWRVEQNGSGTGSRGRLSIVHRLGWIYIIAHVFISHRGLVVE